MNLYNSILSKLPILKIYELDRNPNISVNNAIHKFYRHFEKYSKCLKNSRRDNDVNVKQRLKLKDLVLYQFCLKHFKRCQTQL